MLRYQSIAKRVPNLLFKRPTTTRLNSTFTNKVEVSLNDENPDIPDDFFGYTWGKFLINNDQKRQARETKFSLKGLVEVLKENVGSNNKGEELEVKLITPHHEGKHHKIYKVDLTDGRSFALRIPYSIGHDEFRQARMKSEVATMDFLINKHEMKIPNVVSWNSSKNNPLENEYQLMEFINGDLLMKQWNPASEDIKSKSETIKPVVDFVDKLISTKFNKYGSLYFTDDVSSSLQNDLPYNHEKGDGLIDKYRIGPTTESRFWKGSNVDIGAAFRGPFNTAQEYINATANVQLAYLNELEKTPQVEKALEIFAKYSQIVSSFMPEASADANDNLLSPRLQHPDLSPLNIIVNEKTTPYLVDFENSSIRPFALHGPPRFVLHKGPKIFSLDDIPDFDKLPESEKAAIKHFMAQTQNQFAFEYLFRQLVESQELFNAFLPGLKRRQLTVDTALQSNVESVQDLAYDMAMLSQEWQFINNDMEFPAPYSEAEFDQVAKETDEWNRHIMQNPFMETKGWVPTDTFDKLVNENLLVKGEDGNYVYNPPK